ncbi:MAG: 2-succinyl-5-enolpyruvyl-6-hydroxy-3-cyclohexene-1-carboxylic-acid synthase [Parabacteroides sp.]
MYSNKQNCLQLIALLKAHGISNLVLCPGSRNIPLVQSLAQDEFFHCHAVTDERSAGFFALGLSLHGGKPAAVCCTSGTALLNLHPAVAEAFYQQVPLVVISADRPAAWIGQMDGQTLPQPGVFGPLVKYAVQLPEIHSDEDTWYCNRLINEALMELNHHGKGPVHINVPISEPFFACDTPQLPEVRVITRYQGLNVYDREYQGLIDRLNRYNRRMVVAGQMSLIYLFEKKICKQLYKHFVWLTEHLSNRIVPGRAIKNFDALLYALPEEQLTHYVPDLLITYGGHIVSKRLKHFLRNHPPKEHWHIALDGKPADLFGSLTTVIEMDPFEFLEKIAYLLDNRQTPFPKQWEQAAKQIPEPQFGYSEMEAIGRLMRSLPEESALHLANSSAVRYAQLFTPPESTEICCNRGTSGIEGTLSTALGYASASAKLNFVVIGDLSFFYDLNALWHQPIRPNLRILLLNNGGGEIFRALPGLQMSEETRRFVTATHHTSARGWAEAQGFDYLTAHNAEELEETMGHFASASPNDHPLLLEVFTDPDEDIRQLKGYYHSLRPLFGIASEKE